MIKLNKLFSEGAVFQRRSSIPVWGTVSPYAFVEVVFDNVRSRTASGSDGSFFLRMPAHEAGGPYVLTVRDLSSGETLEIGEILVGEVWLASGQSNMQMNLSATTQLDQFIHENTDPNALRVFTVAQNAKSVRSRDPEGKWEKTTADKVPDFSAVALWFGKHLYDELQVPVGIISASWGGTVAEAWTSRNTLMRNPDFQMTVEDYTFKLNRPETWANVESPRLHTGSVTRQTIISSICIPDKENKGLAQGWNRQDFDDSDWFDSFIIPGIWTSPIWNSSKNGKLQPLCGNGIVWIRKEIILPKDMIGKKLILHLGPVDKHDITYFNGVEVGRRGKDFEGKWFNIPRTYEIPAELTNQSECLLAIRAYSFMYEGCFGGDMNMYYLEDPESGKKLPFGGLCRFEKERDDGFFDPNKEFQPNYSNSPHILFDGMIRPLIPYALKGVIWYQGESNARSIAHSRQYERLMTDLIKDWRFWWEQGDFPFVMVHIAGFGEPRFYNPESLWAVLRESQRRTKHALPNVGLISAVDCGDSSDLHPKDKHSVGKRLCAWAMSNTYGSDKPGEGPSMLRCIYSWSKVTVIFDHCDQGLVTNNGSAPMGFLVAGSDGIYCPANAVIKGNSVELVSADVKNPKSVRFAWADHPREFNLYNSAGFPAEPFED